MLISNHSILICFSLIYLKITKPYLMPSTSFCYEVCIRQTVDNSFPDGFENKKERDLQTSGLSEMHLESSFSICYVSGLFVRGRSELDRNSRSLLLRMIRETK